MASRFVDGSTRRYISSVDAFWGDLIVRGIYGYSGSTEDHTYEEMGVSQQYGCLVSLLGSWSVAERTVDVIAGDRPYAVAGVGWHEYARTGRSSASRAWRRKPKRSRKLCNRKILAKATKAGSFDGDWDVGMDQRSRGVYA